MLNDKVIKTSIERIIVDGGDVLKYQVGDKGYKGFGETYYSKINFAKKGGKKTPRNDYQFNMCNG